MGVKQFHQMFGEEFTIVSDHKPLQHLFNECKATPILASAHIQQWSLILAAYNYKIQFKLGGQHNNADMLSWLPLPESLTHIPTPGETILVFDMSHSLPVTAANIKQWTNCDQIPHTAKRSRGETFTVFHSIANVFRQIMALSIGNVRLQACYHESFLTNGKKVLPYTVLSRVRNMIQQGWQFTPDADFKPYEGRKSELSVHDGCILWGS